MYCPNCGAQAAPNNKFCPSCGVTLDNAVKANSSNYSKPGFNPNYATKTNNYITPLTKKSPILALLLGFLFVGAGQFYLGQFVKGFLMLGLALFFTLLSFKVLWFAVAVWAAIDAFITAKKM
ncbi:MAG: zinc-ribbon domain-containing protein [bacterium]